MKPLHALKNYFNFNKRERNGILILLSILVVITVSRLFINASTPEIKVKITYLDSVSTAIEAQDTLQQLPSFASKEKSTEKAAAKELCVFDPNKLTEAQALRLGFSKKLAKTIVNYCSKGGKFRAKEDLKKLYGMSDKLYSQLEPFVLIEAAAPVQKTLFAVTAPEKRGPRIVELNSADSVQLVSLNGIGPAFARKILKFRNALGGFCSKQQLLEVYGMKDTLYQRFEKNITIDLTLLKKINPNTATYEELKRHPYINHNIASAIVNYRSKHGLFKTCEELMEVGTISDDVLARLKSYLDFS